MFDDEKDGVAENGGDCWFVVVDFVIPIVSYLSSFLFKELLFKETF